jgi:hypothetical protein
MRGAWHAFWAILAVAGASVAPASAEIKKEIGKEGIVATNIRVEPRVPGSNPAGRLAGKPPAVAVGQGAPSRIADLLVGTSARYGFDPALIRAVVLAESTFDHMAVSRKGARGLMQLMPNTARRFGVRDIHDPASNLEGGVAYLRELTLRYGGDVELALAAYNAGPEAVARYGGVPPYEETQKYLGRIRRYYGDDLVRGDWSRLEGEIRLSAVESGGVPHFTNIRPRRIMRPSGAGDEAGPRRAD